MAADKVQEIFRYLFHIYFQTNCKPDPEHIAEVLLIRIKQKVVNIRTIVYDGSGEIKYFCDLHGRSKIAIKILEDKAR